MRSLYLISSLLITVALPDDGRNFRPKHVLVMVTNKWIDSLL